MRGILFSLLVMQFWLKDMVSCSKIRIIIQQKIGNAFRAGKKNYELFFFTSFIPIPEMVQLSFDKFHITVN